MKRILVMGGSGFIGLHLVELLTRQKKYNFTIFDLRRPKFINYTVGFIVDLAGLLDTDGFLAGLSTVDLLFNCGPASKKYLGKNSQFLSK